MCQLQEKIKKKIKNNNKLLCSNRWNTYAPSKLDSKIPLENINILERKNLQTNNNGVEYKYLEYTKWSNNDSWAAIGFNPATTDPNIIDKTNGKIINVLKDYNCGSYILLNLYPQVSTDKNHFNEDDEIDKSFLNTLISILRLLNKRKTKTLIFWGRTVSIPTKVFKVLKTLQQNGILYMTIKKGTHSHYHPARIDIDIEQIKENFFTTTTQLIGEN